VIAAIMQEDNCIRLGLSERRKADKRGGGIKVEMKLKKR
jgi:hypothetical protein